MAEESLQERNERALNATSTDELEELAEDEDEDVRLRVARNANTPASVLEQLAADENWQVRFNVAENMNTPVSVLEKLAEDDERDIRNYVAKNENTSVSILEKLADDKDDYLRINVAEHKNTSVSVLEKLAEDDYTSVRSGVAGNSNTPSSLLEKLAQDDDLGVRYGVAQNNNTPVSLLEKLGNDEEQAVRYWVAQNENTPVSVLEKLAGDEEEDIRQQVAENKSTPVSVLERMGMIKDSTSMENKIIYRITGDGGEQKLVTITKNQFDYFSDKDAEFIREDALFQSVDVPSELSLEEWISVFGELDISGFTFGSSYLEINYNSEFKKILLNKTELKKIGAAYEIKKINLKDFAKKNETRYFLLGELTETGELNSEFQTQAAFNVKKLKISTTSFNDWEIISEISYDGEIIDSVSEENEPDGEEFKILMI
jgi:hypothetical protein